MGFQLDWLRAPRGPCLGFRDDPAGHVRGRAPGHHRPFGPALRRLSLAEEHGAAVELVDRAAYGGFGPDFDREGFTATVAATLVAHQVDLVAMAGFGTVMTEAVHDAFPDRILNTHPALLPAFPGWHGVRDALAAGVAETGCTVHLATLEMDEGPILAQQAVPVLPATPRRRCTSGSRSSSARCIPATVAWALGELEAGALADRAPTVVGAGVSRIDNTEKEQDEEMTCERPAVRLRQGGPGRAGPGPSDLGWELVASGNTSAKLSRGGHRPHRGGRR